MMDKVAAGASGHDVVLSVVVPMYNEADNIGPFFERLEKALDGLDEGYEVVCVDDGSSDGSAERLLEERQRNPAIKIVRLSRNFGKERALTAGSATAQALVARGRFVPPALCALAGALVLTLVLPGLASASGPQGAVLAAGAGMCVWALSLIALLARSGGLALGRGCLRPGAVVLVALGVYMGLEPVAVWLALCASWLVLLGGTLAIGVLAPEERSALMALLRRTRRRRGA